MGRQRILWIDELKGFLLLLVMLRHLAASVEPLHHAMVLLAPMRMPCFFFISGVLFSKRRYTSFGSYFKSKTKSLLLPYIMLSELFLLADPCLWSESMHDANYYYSAQLFTWTEPLFSDYIHAGLPHWIINQIQILLLGFGATITVPLWFVWTLFGASLVCYLVNCSKYPKLWLAMMLLADVLLCVFGIPLLPFNLSSILTAAILLCLGSFAKEYIYGRMVNGGCTGLLKKTLLILLLYLLSATWCGLIDLRENRLGDNLLLSVVAMLSGIYALISLFILLDRHHALRRFRAICSVVAANALVLLPVHFVCKMLLKDFLQVQLSPTTLALITIPTELIVCLASIIIFRGPLHHLLMKERVTWREALKL